MTRRDPGSDDWNVGSVYALFILTLINTLNFFDRGLLSLVLPLIKAEFGVSDTTLGLVNGLFLISAIMGVPVAALADRWSRRNVIAVSLVVWSLATALSGLAGSIMALAFCRVLMSLGEAGGVPPSNSLLSDIFPKRARPLALSIFSCGASLSLLLYAPIAGWIAQHYGWRAAFVAAGAPGLAVAAIFVLTLKEPRHGAADDRGAGEGPPVTPPPFWPAFASLMRSGPYVLMLIGCACMSCINYGTSAWTATFFVRVHDFSIAEVGALIQPIRGLLSLAGLVLGGWLIGRAARVDERWRGWIPAIGCLLYVPCEALFLGAETMAVWMPSFIAASVFSLVYQGGIYSAVMDLAPPASRSVALAAVMLVSTVSGQLLGSVAIGVLNDTLAGTFGLAAVRYSMGLVLIGSAALGSVCFFLAGRRLGEAVALRASMGSGPG
jgi:MFS family permease